MAISVLIADDQDMVRDGLRQILSSAPNEVVVVDEAARTSELPSDSSSNRTIRVEGATGALVKRGRA